MSKKLSIIALLLVIFVSGCCSTQFTPETAKALDIWKQNTKYLNSSLTDKLDNRPIDLNRSLPGGVEHSCLSADDPEKAHVEHLKALILTTNKLADAFSELAKKRTCGN